MAHPIFPAPQQRAQISVMELVCDRVIRKAYRDPNSVKTATLVRIKRAAMQLGISPPMSEAR